MIRHFLLSLSMLVPVFFVVLQKQPVPSSQSATQNLTGMWVLDVSKSDMGSLKANVLYDSLTLEITHDEPKLTIIRKITKDKRERLQRLEYYPDRRGEKNPTFTGSGTVKSKMNWENTVLVLDGMISTPSGGDTMVQKVTERWEISPDGNTLTQLIKTGRLQSTFGKTNFHYAGIETIHRVFTRVH